MKIYYGYTQPGGRKIHYYFHHERYPRYGAPEGHCDVATSFYAARKSIKYHWPNPDCKLDIDREAENVRTNEVPEAVR